MPGNRDLLASMPDGDKADSRLHLLTWLETWYLDNRAAIRLALERGIEAEALLLEAQVWVTAKGLDAKIDAHFDKSQTEKEKQ